MDITGLNELVEGILAIFNTQVIRIVLYGSYARGTNTSESDVDVASFNIIYSKNSSSSASLYSQVFFP